MCFAQVDDFGILWETCVSRMPNEQDHRVTGAYFWPISAALCPKNATDGQMDKLQGRIKTNLFLYLNSWESTRTRSTALHLARWDARKNKNLQVHLHWFPFLLLFLEQCLIICFTISFYVFVLSSTAKLMSF